MTRRDALPRVLRGLEALAALPRGAPDQGQRRRDARLHRGRGAARSRAFAREHPYEVRFIEFMPLDADHAWTPDSVLTGDEIRARSSSACTRSSPSRASRTPPRASTASPTAAGTIGFINPVSEPFCGDCNRIRLTADGRLRTCLFSLNETDLRAPLRAGASDDELEQIIRDAVWRKELKHHVNEPGFVQPARTMSAIGG